MAQGKTPEEATKLVEKKEKAGEGADDDDEYVSVEGAEVDEGVQPGTVKTPAKDERPARAFQNFQKKGLVPNITSVSKRPAGITKGMWKKENLRQSHGIDKFKKQRRGKRAKASPEGPDAPAAGLLGKRDSPQKSTKTATTHRSNTSTFKNQAKKR